jgi:hypothetical protein
MTSVGYLPIIMLFIIIFITSLNERKLVIKNIIQKKKGREYMNEVIQRYIGKDCLIYLSLSSTVVAGNVINLNDNWLTVKTKDGEETVNLDYIIRIKEHPVNKNGKKKSVIF